MGSVNERRRYIATPSLIGWAHTQNDPCLYSDIQSSLRYLTVNIFKELTTDAPGLARKRALLSVVVCPRQNGRHFPDDILKCIFPNENIWISIKTSPKFVPGGPINIIPSLVQIMTWRRPGDKPLSEPMTVKLSTHICVTRPQWVNVIPMVSFVNFLLYVIPCYAEQRYIGINYIMSSWSFCLGINQNQTGTCQSKHQRPQLCRVKISIIYVAAVCQNRSRIGEVPAWSWHITAFLLG